MKNYRGTYLRQYGMSDSRQRVQHYSLRSPALFFWLTL